MVKEEKLVIGCLIMSRRAYEHMLERGLTVGMFSFEYQDIVQQILDYRLDKDTDLVPITSLQSETLSKSEISEFIEFEEHESATLYSPYYSSFQCMYLEAQAQVAIKDARFTKEGIIELADSLLELTEDHEKYSIDQIATAAIEDVIARNNRDYINPYKTGLYDYDKLGHLEHGDLLILGGKSGHGKSRLALNLTNRWLDHGLNVGYFSYEMTAKACMLGLALIKENLSWDGALAQKGQNLQPDQIAGLEMTMDKLKELPLVINEFAETLAQVELVVKRHKLNVFIIDTVNELITDGAQFWIALLKLASGYKKIAKKYGCAGVMLAQLNSEPGRPTKKELLASAKDMKNAADKIDFIYRAEEEDPYQCPSEFRGIMEVFRVKGRFTGTGKTNLNFNGATGKIYELSDGQKMGISSKFKSKRGDE